MSEPITATGIALACKRLRDACGVKWPCTETTPEYDAYRPMLVAAMMYQSYLEAEQKGPPVTCPDCGKTPSTRSGICPLFQGIQLTEQWGQIFVCDCGVEWFITKPCSEWREEWNTDYSQSQESPSSPELSSAGS